MSNFLNVSGASSGRESRSATNARKALEFGAAG